jgi:hypothetical protein
MISTDQTFEYAESRVVDPQRLRSFLEDRLKQYKEAKLTLTGYTDPIGGACFNNKLAESRVDAIEAIVHQFFPADQVKQGKSVVTTGQMSEPDRKIAEKCLETFQRSKPERERPLRPFDADENRDQIAKHCTPDREDSTPNYIWGTRACDSVDEEKKCLEPYKQYDTREKREETLVAMKRAAYFYRLQRCMAPLRRVEITIDNSPGAAGGIGSGAGK